MAFETDFGTGELGDVTITGGAVQNLNSYARVSAINGNTVTLDLENISEGAYEKFRAGVEVLIHVSATNGTDAADLGRYLTANITLVDGSTVTLDKNMSLIYVQTASDAKFFMTRPVIIAGIKAAPV